MNAHQRRKAQRSRARRPARWTIDGVHYTATATTAAGIAQEFAVRLAEHGVKVVGVRHGVVTISMGAL